MLIPRSRAALLALGLCVLVGPALAASREEESEARLRRDITLLASDDYEGRGVGTLGIDKAANYIADQFARAGLKPGGVNGSFFQPFPFSIGAEQDGPSSLTLHGPKGEELPLKPGSDFQVIGFSGAGKVSAPLVFLGYGASAPGIAYDDYKDIDVKDKVVVLIRRTPRWNDAKRPFDGKRRDEHASLDTKQSLAELHKAAAVLLVNDASELPDDSLMPYQTTARGAATSRLPYLHLKRSVLDKLLQSSLDKKLDDVEKAIEKDLKPQSAAFPGWTASLETKVKRKSVEVKNVVGVLEGHGTLAQETVVIGAHYDHLGFGGSGSLAKDRTKKEIHHGADDNGSGTTTLLELARTFGARKDRAGRRLVFMAFTAEESGLIGSRYYTKRQPLFPLADTVAMVNLDMVGRLRPDGKTGKDKLYIEGSGTAKSFDQMLEKLNPGFNLTKKPGGNGPSDHDSFYNQKIPVVFFWTGNHEDYHRPTDTADKINVAGMRRVAEYATRVIEALATEAPRPEYVEIASSYTPGGPRGPRMGIMPDYESEKKGVLVGSVTKDGPAGKAGLKEGDLIVDIGGRAVANVNSYMVVMSQQRAGQPVDVTVLREGKKLQLKVTPQ